MSRFRKGSGDSDQNLGRLVFDDLRRTKRRDYRRELRDLYHFYLPEDRKQELAAMGRFPRAIFLLGWILKSLFLKLSPARRLLLFVATAITLVGRPTLEYSSRTWEIDARPTGFALLLLILMLELKDKLLAKDEIQIARQVQMALLPDRRPNIPGWSVWSCSRPANDVGGDLVDYLEVDGFRHAVLVGDVAGKGLGAALLSAKLQATLRALLPDAASLDELGVRVNSILYRDGLENRYATLFFAELEHDSGQIRYLNAGHNPALLVKRESIQRLPASSRPLGMLPHVAYRECNATLEEGDLLVAYSDGLTEASDDVDVEFGLERVESLLEGAQGAPPEAVGQRLLDAVDRFTGDQRVGDDLSLIVIARTRG